MPERLKPQAPSTSAVTPTTEIDGSLFAIVMNWRIVVAELNARGIDIYDAAVRARPWPGVRTAIFDLIDTPGSRLRAALTRR